WHARALHRRWHDDLLQRPGRDPEPGRARNSHGRHHARRRRRPGYALAQARLGADARRGHRPGLRHHRGHRLRGPPRLRRDRDRHELGGAALWRGRCRADPRLGSGGRGRGEPGRTRPTRAGCAERVWRDGYGLGACAGYDRLPSMAISVRQIHPVFVGEVSGIDIGKPLSPDEVGAIEAGMDRYAVLVFHDQKIADEQQMAFSRNFGNLEDARGGNITKPEDKRLQVGMNDVSNLGRDGQPLTRESRVRLFNLGNMLWHSDSSFRAIPAKYSLLSARVVNPVGGNTEFADMRAAYDTLDAGTKTEIA